MKRLLLLLLFASGVSAVAFESIAAADDPARFSLAEARKIALARVPGTIVSEKLKNKKHHHPIYSIKIRPSNAKTDATLKKVEVDGDTAKIIKVKDVKAKAKAED